MTLAQLVKAFVSHVDVLRFKSHLVHKWFRCGVFLVKSRRFGLPLAQTIRPNWQLQVPSLLVTQLYFCMIETCVFMLLSLFKPLPILPIENDMSCIS